MEEVRVVKTHLRFPDAEQAQQYILWLQGHVEEVKPIQRWKTLDRNPAGAFKLEEREEYLNAPVCIAIVGGSLRAVYRKPYEIDNNR